MDVSRSIVASYVLCEVCLLAETEDSVNTLQSETVRKLRKAFVPTMMTAEQASTFSALAKHPYTLLSTLIMSQTHVRMDLHGSGYSLASS